jgi:hypothetical protein
VQLTLASRSVHRLCALHRPGTGSPPKSASIRGVQLHREKKRIRPAACVRCPFYRAAAGSPSACGNDARVQERLGVREAFKPESARWAGSHGGCNAEGNKEKVVGGQEVGCRMVVERARRAARRPVGMGPGV